MDIVLEYFKSFLTPAQLIGVGGLIMAIISFQQNVPKRMVICQLIANTLFTVHFFMLGAVTGAAINLMSALRSVIYAQTDKKWATHPAWSIVFIIIPIIIGICSWEGFKSLFPVLAAICFTISFRMKTSKMVRLVSFPASPLWIIYNVINKSYPGILTELYVMTSIIVGMIRFDISKKK